MSRCLTAFLLLLPSLGLAAGDQAPESGQASFSGAEYLIQVSVGLLVVLAGIVALAWMVRRMGGFQHSAGGNLKVLEGLAIGPRERIVLLQCGSEQIVVGIAPGRVQTLHVLEQPVEVSQPTSLATAPFARRLQEALRARGGTDA